MLSLQSINIKTEADLTPFIVHHTWLILLVITKICGQYSFKTILHTRTYQVFYIIIMVRFFFRKIPFFRIQSLLNFLFFSSFPSFLSPPQRPEISIFLRQKVFSLFFFKELNLYSYKQVNFLISTMKLFLQTLKSQKDCLFKYSYKYFLSQTFLKLPYLQLDLGI